MFEARPCVIGVQPREGRRGRRLGVAGGQVGKHQFHAIGHSRQSTTRCIVQPGVPLTSPAPGRSWDG